MTEKQAKGWAKEHWESVIDAVLEPKTNKQSKVAIFMAGVPGAGKTEFAERWKENSSYEIVSIEHDKLVEHIEGYTPERYYDFRKAGNTLVEKLFDRCLKDGRAFIFDGTLAHDSGKRNVRKALRKGYVCVVVFIAQNPRLAWRLTEDRELVTKRAIKRDGFTKSLKSIHPKLKTIVKLFGDHPNFDFWMVDKLNSDGKSTMLYIYSNSVDEKLTVERFLDLKYNLDIGDDHEFND